MSKLYEVLENASREREKRTTGRTKETVFEPAYSKIETEMVGLYQTIDAAIGKKESRTVQFIGTAVGDGCSTIARDFARTAANRLRESVLLMDLNQPSIGSEVVSDVTFHHDFEEVLSDQLPLDKTACRIERPSLFVTSLSSKPDAPLMLMNMADHPDLWVRLRTQFSLIIIDAPPASVLPIGFSLLKKVDGVVLVVRAEKTRWPASVSLKEKIVSHGGKIIGAVYNDRRYYIPKWLYNYL